MFSSSFADVCPHDVTWICLVKCSSSIFVSYLLELWDWISISTNAFILNDKETFYWLFYLFTFQILYPSPVSSSQPPIPSCLLFLYAYEVLWSIPLVPSFVILSYSLTIFLPIHIIFLFNIFNMHKVNVVFCVCVWVSNLPWPFTSLKKSCRFPVATK